MSYVYRESVLKTLERHGVRPNPDTPPDLVHDFVNDLYRYEIRCLRDQMRSGLIPKKDYASRVRQLRDRYTVLALPKDYWTINPNPTPKTNDR